MPRDRYHGNQLYGKLKILLGQKLKHLNRGHEGLE